MAGPNHRINASSQPRRRASDAPQTTQSPFAHTPPVQPPPHPYAPHPAAPTTPPHPRATYSEPKSFPSYKWEGYRPSFHESAAQEPCWRPQHPPVNPDPGSPHISNVHTASPTPPRAAAPCAQTMVLSPSTAPCGQTRLPGNSQTDIPPQHRRIPAWFSATQAKPRPPSNSPVHPRTADCPPAQPSQTSAARPQPPSLHKSPHPRHSVHAPGHPAAERRTRAATATPHNPTFPFGYRPHHAAKSPHRHCCSRAASSRREASPHPPQ